MAPETYTCVVMDARRTIIQVNQGAFVSALAAELWAALCADALQDSACYELYRGSEKRVVATRPFGDPAAHRKALGMRP